jgi:hypothetical protein
MLADRKWADDLEFVWKRLHSPSNKTILIVHAVHNGIERCRDMAARADKSSSRPVRIDKYPDDADIFAKHLDFRGVLLHFAAPFREGYALPPRQQRDHIEDKPRTALLTDDTASRYVEFLSGFSKRDRPAMQKVLLTIGYVLVAKRQYGVQSGPELIRLSELAGSDDREPALAYSMGLRARQPSLPAFEKASRMHEFWREVNRRSQARHTGSGS